jgi:26S proteasome regulatory subunit N2
MAYQISFDLEENATQEFLSKVAVELPSEPATQESEDAMQEDKVKR